jgi:hypothetical protein
MYGQSTVPTEVTSVTKISAGATSTCSVSAAGNLTCWGNNNFGQAIVGFGAGAVSSVSVGANATCILNSSQKVRCWGNDTKLTNLSPDYLNWPLPPAAVQLAYRSSGVQVFISDYNTPNPENPHIWQVIDSASGNVLCTQTQNEPSCELTNFEIGENYRLKIFAINNLGTSPFIEVSGINCPNVAPEIALSNNANTVPGGKVRFFGQVINLCLQNPKTILYREKPSGKSWSTWKAYSLTSAKKFSFYRTFGFETEVQMKTLSGTGEVAAISTQILVNPKQKMIFSSSRIHVSKFPQGGYLKFKFTAHSNYSGMCTVLAQTPFAYNFAMVLIGQEQNLKSFRVTKGIGNATLKMRWNGQVTMTIECHSRFFPNHDYSATKTTLFRGKS